MYFLTSICSTETYNPVFVEKRTFGFFLDLNKAEESVKNNEGNLNECLYDFLVIEEIGEGIHSPSQQEIWYAWNNKNWEKLNEKPEWATGTTNWALG
jgi:hypothetical protein